MTVYLDETGLHRLFASELFDANIAIHYLFKSKEVGILQFLGNRLFDLPPAELDFYLPQLLILYLYTEEDTRKCIHPFLVKRCKGKRRNSSFSKTIVRKYRLCAELCITSGLRERLIATKQKKTRRKTPKRNHQGRKCNISPELLLLRHRHSPNPKRRKQRAAYFHRIAHRHRQAARFPA